MEKKPQNNAEAVTGEYLPITQEIFEQLLFQQSANGDQSVAVVFDPSGTPQQYMIEACNDQSPVFLQTLSSENMDIT